VVGKHLTKKHAPKQVSDLLGNPSAHKQLKELIQNNGRALLVGSPGIGKTSAVYAVANELGFDVIELNASDSRRKDELKTILRRCQMLRPDGRGMIYLLDEVDGVGVGSWSTLTDILTLSKYPVVMTANEDWKVNDEVKKLCIVIKLRRPYLNTVVTAAKSVAESEKAQKVDFSGIKQRDIRNAINVVMYGGESYETSSIFDKVHKFFTRGEIEGITKKDLVWLMDNAPRYLNGAELYKFYRILDVACRSDVSILKFAPRGRGGYPTFPSFYRLRSRRNKNNGNRKR